MAIRQFAVLFGLLSIVLCLSTWVMDLSDLVVQCIYCRNQRTIIGLLGIILLLPIYPYITRYLSLVFGFFGASVAAQHIMMTMEKSGFHSPQLPLAICSLFFIIGQVYFIFSLSDNLNKTLNLGCDNRA